MIFLEKIVGS